MARGWESKAVESQIEAAQKDLMGENAITERSQAELELSNRRNTFLLARAKVLQDLGNCKNQRYRKLLEFTLADLERQIAELD